MTGEVIRSSRATTQRYERDLPGELVHVDVKKLGRIPAGGGWRVRGNESVKNYEKKRRRIGYDYVHSMVDDHSRLAYSEVLADENGATCAGFIARAAAAFAAAGIESMERGDDRQRHELSASSESRDALADLGARHVHIRPHCPWQNGKVERFNRTLQIEWAYRHILHHQCGEDTGSASWLRRYNTQRPHSALGGRPPISRLS